MRLGRRGAVIATLLMVLATGSPFASPAQGAPSSAEQQQIKKQISALRTELNEVSADEAELLGRLDDINNRKAEVDGNLAELQGRIDAVQAELEAATAKLAIIQQQIDQATLDLQAAQDALTASTVRMQQQAVDAYVGKRPTDDVSEIIFNATDLRQVSAAGAYLRQLVANRREVVEDHRELEGRAEDLRKQLDGVQSAAEAERAVVASRSAALGGQKAELVVLQRQVQVDADAQNVLLAEVGSRRAEFEAQLVGLQRESDNIAALLRAVSSTSGPVQAPGKGILASPLPGSPITSPFGTRVHPIFGTVRLHAGQDYGAPSGAPIRAAANGTVVQAGWVSGYGNYTCLSHGGGLATCYAHQTSINVATGQVVGRGGVIGTVGSTGNSTGPHLHFEVRVNGNPVDPRSYM